MNPDGIRFKANRRGVKSLLKLPSLKADLLSRAESVADAAGPGHDAQAQTGPVRVGATVMTKTHEAMRAEATRRTLTAAVTAARR